MEIVVCYFSALSLYIFFLLCLLLLLFALLDHAVHNFHFFPASSFCIYIILVLHFLSSARNIHSTWLTSCTHRLQQPHTRQQQLDSVASFPFLPACLVNWTLSSACCMLLAMVFRDNFIVIFYTFSCSLHLDAHTKITKTKFISSERHDSMLKLAKKMF